MLAQRGGHGGGGGGMRGGGSVGVRSGGGFTRGATGGVRVGGGVSGFRGGFGHNPFFGSGFRFNRFPRNFFYPGFYGGFGFYDPFWYDSYPYYNPYPYAGYAGDYGYSPAAQAPPVIINQGFQPEPPPAPMIQEYVDPAPQQQARSGAQSTEPPLYLIAFNDGSIKAVVAYWVDGKTLHYVTMDHEQKQAPLASVDRALSERFNRERNVTFQLPR